MRTPSLALLLTLALAAPTFAQRHNPDPKNPRERIAAIALHAKQAEQAFTIGDWPQAEIALREQIRLDDTSWVPRFNLAIALANMDRTDNAATELKSAIDAGFFDLARLQPGPDQPPARAGQPTEAAGRPAGTPSAHRRRPGAPQPAAGPVRHPGSGSGE